MNNENNHDSNSRQATQADTGWRSEEARSGRQATQADTGWRSEEARSGRQATQADEGWRRAAADMLDPGNVMNSATANAYSTLESFQEAVSKLPELVSSTGTSYPVKKTLSKAGGESAILLCADQDGNDIVAKVYYEPVNSAGSSISARTRVLEYMGTEDGKKYTLAVSEIGLVELGGSRYYFEMMPYCDSGDLTHEPPFSFEELVALTKHLNEALYSMHSAGILHRDIKPDNLYRLDGNVVIGDFGVAKLARAGVTRHTAGTDGYRAPESVLAVSAGESAFFFDEKCDYYSLGVTLGSLFEGHFVYEGMDAAMITASVRNGRLPLIRTDAHREQLENLISGLCRYDSRYRFGYEDVNRWLIDHNYRGGVLEEEWPKAFRMLNEEYRDEKSLFFGITKDDKHWDEGKSMLFSKYFENFFMSFRTDLARAAQITDELWRTKDRDKGLSVFLKSLFAPGPIVWKGYSFNSLKDLANKMAVTRTPAAYGEILQKRCLSHWLENTEGISVNEDTANLVASIETQSDKEPELACYWFGNSFAAGKSLTICKHEVSDMEGLINAMFSSPGDFYFEDGLAKLLNRQEGADLYGFLYSFGYKPVVDAEWEHVAQSDEFNKVCILISMIDMIAAKEGVDSSLVRNFFVNYGPMGIASYTKMLLSRTGNPVYVPMDEDGKQALARITDFRTPNGSTVDELFRAYIPLLDNVDKMRRSLTDNPYCVMTGAYENQGIVCTNLVGCFAFEILGRMAPLGFSAWIENANGGVK